ncbi:MAG: bifunctional phosphopantothenoylcysteine decarboxylase/phosphopantothenate--cysteine ligase CoaBC [Microbacteriaceae bacterium]|nr:bifunctional phosphopantothenoylcysteine decarboxylase/phosphopantothenate--cysteine ligase CoaBC [Microbacteriaceae bacterium]
MIEKTRETAAEIGRALKIVVGVSGGIAAFKAVQLVRQLVLAGHDVHVIPTEAALRFVGKPTFEAISRNPVYTDVFDDVAEVRHVALGQSADVIVVAPATANRLAQMATGLAGDLLGTTLLAARCRVVVAPAMHTEMWEHSATRHNMEVLRQRGVAVVGPGTGQLTGSDVGAGRMAEPEEIAAEVLRIGGQGERLGRGELQAGADSYEVEAQDLAGQRILITAGGTREAIDPVRFLGNHSSGKQAVAIAQRALARGAEVTLVAANIEVPAPHGVNLVRVDTAREMAAACEKLAASQTAVIMAAAVADYRPETASESKIAKEDAGESLTLHLVKNPDILATLSRNAPAGQTVVGFAAETESDEAALLERTRRKLERKGCDFLVVNRVGANLTFGADTNDIFVLARDGKKVASVSGSKVETADAVLNLLVS